MHRRSCLAASAAASGGIAKCPSGAVRPADAAAGNLTSIDPICTTAAITRNHGFMMYDTLYGPATRPQCRCVVRPAGDPATGMLRASRFNAPDEAARKAICADIQRVALDEGAVIPLGSTSAFTATLADLEDRVNGLAPFWNPSRT